VTRSALEGPRLTVIILWPREGFATKWTVRQEKLIVENVEKLLTISEVAEMLGVPLPRGGSLGLPDWAACSVSPREGRGVA
jgi:hypothetical protein